MLSSLHFPRRPEGDAKPTWGHKYDGLEHGLVVLNLSSEFVNDLLDIDSLRLDVIREDRIAGAINVRNHPHHTILLL
jgi:hypothetical protein